MKPCLHNIEQSGHKEEWELFRHAVTEALERHWQQELSTSNLVPLEPSHRYKENMNRIFHELSGGAFQPYPDENTCQSDDSEKPMSK